VNSGTIPAIPGRLASLASIACRLSQSSISLCVTILVLLIHAFVKFMLIACCGCLWFFAKKSIMFALQLICMSECTLLCLVICRILTITAALQLKILPVFILTVSRSRSRHLGLEALLRPIEASVSSWMDWQMPLSQS